MNAALVSGLAALALTLVASTPTYAGSRIEVSSDGAHWGRHLTRPLFDPSVRWVPGDRRTSTFYVRNQGESGALLRVRVRGRGQADLLQPENLSLEARTPGAAWHPLVNRTTSHVLTHPAIAVGDAVPVQVRATFDAGATNESQSLAVGLVFTVLLEDARAGAPPTGGLPGTGAPEIRGWILFAAILMGLGLALVRRSRREGSR